MGVGAASFLQVTLASVGLGTLIVQSQPAFATLRWLGIGYLVFLAAMSLRSARLGSNEPTEQQTKPGHRTRGLRQGFLCNVTNPKMFVFYLSLLPQFVGQMPLFGRGSATPG